MSARSIQAPLLGVALLLVGGLCRADPLPERPIAIVHGLLLTISHGEIPDGVVVLRSGRIVAVGDAATPVPKHAQVVDARGKVVYPGLFDIEDTLGLVEGDSSEVATASGDATGAPSPAALIADKVHPTEAIDVERVNGITHAVITAGGVGPLPGHSAVIQLVDDKSHMVIERDAGLVINFEGRREDAYPSTVFGIVGMVRDLFSRARQLADYHEPPGPDDQAAASLIPYLDGGQPVIAHAVNDTEVADALDLAEAFKLRLILVGLTDVDREIDRIARARVPVALGMLLDDPAPGRRYDYIFRLPGRLAAKGVSVSITTLGQFHLPGGERNLPYEAGVAVPFGLSHELAMRAITLAPAEAFGLDGELGSLDPGKVGDVVIADGDPLDVKTHVEQVFIGGRPIPMANWQTRLRDRYLPKKTSHQ
jgi:imidazolonepropionase-like amidohydrolase